MIQATSGRIATPQGLGPGLSRASRVPAWLAPIARRIPLVAILGILGVAVYGTVSFFQTGGTISSDSLTGVWAGWKDVVLDPRAIGFLVILGLLQWAFPARRDNRSWSAGAGGDLVWFLVSPIRDVTIVAAFLTALGVMVDALSHGHQAHFIPDTNLIPTLSFIPTISFMPAIQVSAVALVAFVVGDFLAWCSHILHHRLPTLWQFHAVHHSQRSMSMLSDNREHFVETLINAAFIFVPARLLGLDSDAAGALAFLSNYLQAMNHANIRTTLGPLRFILVSPQHHRIHHSLEREHYNINYGSTISTWDYLFHTRFPDKAVYPAAGINDDSFPIEKSMNPFALFGTWCRQVAYPFRVIASRATAAGDAAALTAAAPAEPAAAVSSNARLTDLRPKPELTQATAPAPFSHSPEGNCRAP